MEREVAARLERIEADLAATSGLLAVAAQSLTRYAEAADARMKRIEESQQALQESQEALQRMLGGLIQSIGSYVDTSDARLERIEANLDGLIRAIAAEHTNGHAGQ